MSYTVKTDTTAPVVAAAAVAGRQRRRLAQGLGQHRLVGHRLRFRVAPGFPSPATDTVTAETPAAGVVKTSTAKDNAGNTGTGSATSASTRPLRR